ncbi:uncharacterized protein N7483_012482 [Penicillium malachiteum]|uniref:uncharacterized protein n=1 Tax=Penicillium malachiteum TaxID=1324776 RepID=UPI00254714E4|nr:uncharacterized protein N7483_012482 [Penicillium malachiteum]KAJ5715301.1 hypothetical protein N7483_012482 [Penicillium malachiteum]
MMRQLNCLIFLSILNFIPSGVQAKTSVALQQQNDFSLKSLLQSLHTSRDPISGETKCCPIGYHFDGKDCVISPDCDSGCYFDSGKCHAREEPRCPGDGIPNGMNCFTTKGPECPTHAELKDKTCVVGQPQCGDGFEYDHSLRSCVSIESPQCGDSYDFSKGRCITKKRPECRGRGATRFENGHCIGTSPPVCDKGSYNDKLSLCQADAPRCPGGSSIQGNVCISKNGPSCARADDEYDPDMKKCTSKSHRL